MLAGMSSLATLAEAGHAKAPEFNAIFYATVATIIPVLFVAGALQADTYAKLIETSTAAWRLYLTSNVLREEIKAAIIFTATLSIPIVILVYGVWGEIQALLDLYLQRPIGPVGFLKAPGPLIAAASLTVSVAIGPAARLASSLFQPLRTSQRSETAENPPGEELHANGTTPGEPTPREGDKTGSDQPHKEDQAPPP
jgi:hypothetical protein